MGTKQKVVISLGKQEQGPKGREEYGYSINVRIDDVEQLKLCRLGLRRPEFSKHLAELVKAFPEGFIFEVRNFQAYMEFVDGYLHQLCQMTSDMIDDYDYYTMFEDKVCPRCCAEKALEAAMEGVGMKLDPYQKHVCVQVL